MTIPLIIAGPGDTAEASGELADGVSILDVAPTIAQSLGMPVSEEWEGRAIV
jgi:arylsulfatase A-like enzyme